MVGIFLHPVTFGGIVGVHGLGFGHYDGNVLELLLPSDRSRLLQRRGRVFAFRSCGPGSIATSGGWDFSAPCDMIF